MTSVSPIPSTPARTTISPVMPWFTALSIKRTIPMVDMTSGSSVAGRCRENACLRLTRLKLPKAYAQLFSHMDSIPLQRHDRGHHHCGSGLLVHSGVQRARIGTPARPTIIRWVKVIGWRYTSDAFGAASNALVEDCFTRTNDDVIYPCGLGIRRLVIWHDGNGSSFLLTSLPFLKGRPLVVEDCDVIFARQSQYRFSSGSRIFNMRGEGKGEGGRNVIFRNIRVEDPRPTQQAFLIQMATEKPYVWPEPMSRGPGDLARGPLPEYPDCGAEHPGGTQYPLGRSRMQNPRSDFRQRHRRREEVDIHQGFQDQRICGEHPLQVKTSEKATEMSL